MRTRSSLLVVLFALCGAIQVSALQPPYEARQPVVPVEVLRDQWHDAARNRDVPVKIYYPAKGEAPFPVIIFSHGLGGSSENYEYLGRYWAGCGYISVHLQHHGSDDLVWKNLAPGVTPAQAMRNSVADISNALNRALDVTFAIDQLEKLNTTGDSPLKGRLDLKHLGMAGHSFGGWTTMAVAGQLMGPQQKSLVDPRISAAIEMSAPVPPLPAERVHAFEKISVPVLHMTGTLDDSPLGDTKAGQRRLLYDATTHAPAYLVIFNGADHMTFAGHIFRKGQDGPYQSLICAGSVAFWDAYLRGNPAALDWLAHGGYAKLVGNKGVFEEKQPAGK